MKKPFIASCMTSGGGSMSPRWLEGGGIVILYMYELCGRRILDMVRWTAYEYELLVWRARGARIRRRSGGNIGSDSDER